MSLLVVVVESSLRCIFSPCFRGDVIAQKLRNPVRPGMMFYSYLWSGLNCVSSPSR
jgi:hypothetical protein